jgi:GNAT superfamily N-acetyltransferase
MSDDLPTERPYGLTITDIANEQDRAFLSAQLKAFNNRISPYHLAVRTQPPRPLDIFIREQHNTIVGGLVAETYWGWLAVEDLWIDERLRGQGYGRRLIEQAELAARRRGCRYALLTTYSFQARGFYEKLGYWVVGQMDDYPPGSSYFWLRKDFDPT